MEPLDTSQEMEAYLLRTAYFRWLVRVIRVDRKCESKIAAFVDTCSVIDHRLCRDGGVGEAERSPSSGVMVRLKLRASAGSGKLVFIVLGSSSSVKSRDSQSCYCGAIAAGRSF